MSPRKGKKRVSNQAKMKKKNKISGLFRIGGQSDDNPVNGNPAPAKSKPAYRFSATNLILGLDPIIPRRSSVHRTPASKTSEAQLSSSSGSSDGSLDSSESTSSEENDKMARDTKCTKACKAISDHEAAETTSESDDTPSSSSNDDTDAECALGRNANIHRQTETSTNGGCANATGTSTGDESSSTGPETAESEHSCEILSNKEGEHETRARGDKEDAAESVIDSPGDNMAGATSTDDEDDAVSEVTRSSGKSVTFAAGTRSPAQPPALTAQVGSSTGDGGPPAVPGTSSPRIVLSGDLNVNNNHIPHIEDSSTGVNDWSLSEDIMILKMKDQGAEWSTIASSIRRTKNQVRKRYHEVRAAQANVAAANKDSAQPKSFDSAAYPPGEPTFTDNMMSSDDHVFDVEDYEYENGDGEYDDDGEEDETEEEEDDRFNDELWNTHDSAAQGSDEILRLLRDDNRSTSSSATDEEDYDASDYDPFADPADPVAYERERRRSERYLRRHIQPQLYGQHEIIDDFDESRSDNIGRRDPFVSQGFSRRDRQILSDLCDRRIATQWLEMQANFFNATGRMIPLHLIKAKLENQSPNDVQVGYLARGERKVADWSQRVAHGNELLDPDQACDAPEDAMQDSDEDSEDEDSDEEEESSEDNDNSR